MSPGLGIPLEQENDGLDPNRLIGIGAGLEVSSRQLVLKAWSLNGPQIIFWVAVFVVLVWSQSWCDQWGSLWQTGWGGHSCSGLAGVEGIDTGFQVQEVTT